MSNIFQPDSSSTFLLSNSVTLSANNTTANVPVFRITGSVLFIKLYGVVTTVIGSNHTGAYFRLNDQTTQTNITLNTGGGTLSAAAVGTLLLKSDVNTVVVAVKTSAAGRFFEQSAFTTFYPFNFSEFAIVKKSGANTDIEYSYATTDAPTSGVIQFFVEYKPISADGAVAAV